MIEFLAATAVGLAATGALFVLVLVVRRFYIVRAERIARDAEQRVRPLALALAEGERVDLRPLSEQDAQALAALLVRLSQWLSGDARRHIAAFFERSGNFTHVIQGLSDSRAWRRATAAYLLGDMASSEAVSPLLEALDDADRDVRTAAARSLGRLGAVEASCSLVSALVERKVSRAVVGPALLSIGPSALPALRAFAAHTEADVRAFTVELIGFLGGTSDEPLLLEQLRDESAEVRAKACRSLGRLAAERANAELQRALSDPIAFVRVNAATALGAVGDPSTVPALLARARDDASFDAARAAARAAARLDARAVLEASQRGDGGPHLDEAADLIEVKR